VDATLTLATNQWQMTGEAAFEEIVFSLVDKDHEQAKLNSDLPATAASNGSVRVLEKLHRIGADVSKADLYRWTPLTLAKRLQYTDVERFLKHQVAWGGTLPSAWVPHAAIKGAAEVASNDLEIIHESRTQCVVSTIKPLPAGLDKYYFEVTSRKLAEDKEQPDSPFMGIGFCTLGAQYYEFPGWEPKRSFPSGRSWAHHGDDGGFYDGRSTSPQSYGELYGPGDTVGTRRTARSANIQRTVRSATTSRKEFPGDCFQSSVCRRRSYRKLTLEGRNLFNGLRPTRSMEYSV
jgi:hypothetical protein